MGHACSARIKVTPPVALTAAAIAAVTVATEDSKKKAQDGVRYRLTNSHWENMLIHSDSP